MKDGNSRTSNSFRNISSGLVAQSIQMVLGFVSRTVFIKYLSAEYLGVSSLFSNILTMLSLAELGIASAFIYELYKPLSEKNQEQTAVILRYFRKAYYTVGIIVFITGLILIPFLNNIIAEKPVTITEDIRLIYLLYIISTSSSYFFAYKVSMLDADQKISVSTFNNMKFLIGQNIVQILVLIFTHNFLLYLVVQIVSQLLSNIFISRIVDRNYAYLLKYKDIKIKPEVKKNIITNVKAAFFTKIGGVLVNGTDNIFISSFVGLALLGKYSNYVMLFGLISSFLMIIFANIKSSVAHFIINENLEKQREIFHTINFLNFLCFGLSSLFIYFCINDFITLWIGNNYVLPSFIPLMLAVNFFMVGMQNGFWTFKGAYGFFRHGKYMVLGTAGINLVLSYFMGKEYGIAGIITATAIARLLTNFWYDPYIVLRKGLKQNPVQYLYRFCTYVLVLLISAVSVYFIFRVIDLQIWLQIILKVIIISIITIIVLFVILGRSSEFKNSVLFLKRLPLLKKIFK
jgi:O-antigen/teichoic acid export membrane protein